MPGKIIRFEGHTMHYYRYGRGSRILLAFHGFGQTGQSLRPLAEVMADRYTTYCIDIFYHGKSHWGSSEKKLTKAYWEKLLNHFTRQHRIDSFSLLAFSMGGKFAFSALEAMSHRIEQLFLLAPDGIQSRKWYNLATHPVIFQRYFKSMITKPHRFYRIINIVNKTGILEKGIIKLAYNQMNSTKKRRRVYYTWVIFKKLVFDISRIARIINTRRIAVHLFIGRHDKIITVAGMNRLLSALDNPDLHVLECSHYNLINHTAAFLAQNK